MGNLVINGVASSNGGTFDDVIVNGKGTVNSEIKCKNLESNGIAVFKGNIVSQNATVNGTATFHGSLSSKSMEVSGSAKFLDDVLAENLHVSGNAKFGSKVKGTEILLEGNVSVAGDCEAEEINIHGTVKMEGELNAEKIEMNPLWRCFIREMGGQQITVKKVHSISSWLKPFTPTGLKVDSIEGDDIVLEMTTAKVVRGARVKIGPKCEIDLVEYKDTFEKDSSAVVKEYREI